LANYYKIDKGIIVMQVLKNKKYMRQTIDVINHCNHHEKEDK